MRTPISPSGLALISNVRVSSQIQGMADYVLRYVDDHGSSLREETIASQSDGEAIAIVREMRVLVQSELWRRGRLVGKFGPRSKLLAESKA